MIKDFMSQYELCLKNDDYNPDKERLYIEKMQELDLIAFSIVKIDNCKKYEMSILLERKDLEKLKDWL